MLFPRLFSRSNHEQAVHSLYSAVVAQARLPDFYIRLGVPDTLDGRFELVVLHAFLVMRRLKRRDGEAEARTLSQALFDLMFADMDQSLREMGVGDMGVSKRIKQMVEAFYGRVTAYEEGLNAVGAVLEEGLKRNLYGTVEVPAGLSEIAVYVRAQDAGLAATPTAALLEGRVDFAPLGGKA